MLGVFIACLISSMAVTAQTRITGKVIGSDDKLPVAGASIKLRGTNAGTVTDANGSFAISANINDVLVITFIGYAPKQVTVTGPNLGTITLGSTNSTLNEVVVTGYQSQRRKDISGSVAIVDVNAAKAIPTTNAESLLQGQASGVTVVESGVPGQGANVFVRGISNFGNSSPLYVIDGVQETSMSNINANDIESISVLKDAGSAAIYGVSGGNGVVVVTTKKGKLGKTKFEYNGSYGTTQPKSGNVWNVLNAQNYLALIQKVDPQNPLVANGIKQFGYQGASAKGIGNSDDPNANPSKYFLDPNNPGNDYLIQRFDNGQGTDWFHTVFKSAPQQQHTFTASGASDKNSYLFSLGYTDQEGSLAYTYFKRYQARLNTTFALNDHIRVGESMQTFYTESPNNVANQNEGNAISETYRMEPQIPLYDIRGNYGGTYDGPTQLGNATNPLANQNATKNNYSRSWNVEGTVYAEVDFLKHFTVRTSFSGVADNFYYDNINPNPYWSGEGHSNANGTDEGAGYNISYNWTNTLNYNQTFGKHNFKVLLATEAREYVGRFINAHQNSFFSLDPAFVGVGNGSDAGSITASSGPTQSNSVLSQFGRFDYNYDSKYYLGATIRRDGSSVFYPGRQYGTFPSVSLAWRISQENFMKGISWLNELKLRGSTGSSGFNGNVPASNAYSSFQSSIGNSSYPITGSISSAVLGFFASQFGNTKTTWETDKISNIGFDASFFGHLDVSAEYYIKKTTNLLFQVALPATVGGGAPPSVNVGSLQNQGVDISLTYRGNVGNDFKYSIGGTITSYKNKITALNSSFQDNYQRNGAIVNDQVGSPIGEFYGYKVAGYFSSAADVAASAVQDAAAPGRFKYADINGDNKITPADRVNLGNPNPDFTYGFNISASYKNFDFAAVFYGSHGAKIYNYIKYWTDFYSTLTGNKGNDLLFNSWSPTNLNPKTPIAEAVSTFSSDQTVNSWYVEDGSFLKLKSLQLGYAFKPALLKNVGIDRLRIYVQGLNLFTITSYKGLDPELPAVGANGIGTDIGIYPNNERKYIFGVNLSF
jgi:TonB-linked SusC/RagA family outer membrane protein